MKQTSTPQPTLPPPPQSASNTAVDTATLDLLNRWRREDATTDPEQIRVAEQELAEFKQAMNHNRTGDGETILYP